MTTKATKKTKEPAKSKKQKQKKEDLSKAHEVYLRWRVRELLRGIGY